MPTFEDDEPPVPALPPSVAVTDLNYQGIPNDVKQHALSTLTTHIRGTRWVVDFYSQLVGEDGELRPLSPNTLAIHQQYKFINNLETKVTTSIPINPTLDLQSQEMESRGQLNLYANTVIPKLYDHFTARMPDGRLGLFVICQAPEAKTIFQLSTYTVEFLLLRFLSNEDAKLLRERTQESYVFIRDRIGTGVNPTITTDEYDDYEQLMGWKTRIPSLYLNKFFDREYATLTLPEQPETTYDPFHAYFVQAMFGSEMSGVMNGLNHVPVMDGQRTGILTFWDVILQLDANVLSQVEPKFEVVSTKNFLSNPYMRGIRYSGLKRVVYRPNPIWTDCNSRYQVPEYETYQLTAGTRTVPKIRSTLSKLFPNEVLGYPYGKEDGNAFHIRPVLFDDCYVLSEHFYAHDVGNMSMLEELVWDALENSFVDPKRLMLLIEFSERWASLEQFYYIPLLYALIPAATRGI